MKENAVARRLHQKHKSTIAAAHSHHTDDPGIPFHAGAAAQQ